MSTETTREPTANALIETGGRPVKVERYEDHLTVVTPTDSVRLDRPDEAENVALAIQALIPKTEKPERTGETDGF